MISDRGIKFIQKWESCSLKAYEDIAGIWTIGWGTILVQDVFHDPEHDIIKFYKRPVKSTDVITQSQADKYLMEECTGIDNKLKLLVIPLTQNEMDAIISFCYNLGVTAFRNSTLRKLINCRATDVELEREWIKWNKIHKDGKLIIVRGLARRRMEEFGMFIWKLVK